MGEINFLRAGYPLLQDRPRISILAARETAMLSSPNAVTRRVHSFAVFVYMSELVT
jgi:hypothetical protein